MKKALLLFAALLVAGCGEKSSSEGSESASESAEHSADTAKPIPAEPPSEESSETPKSLSDADVERRGLGQGIIGCPRFHTFYIFLPL